MELNPIDVQAFLTCHELGCNANKSEKILLGHISASNCYGFKAMDVAVKILHRSGGLNVDKQFENELKLRHLHHKNIIGLVGFSVSLQYYYIVYEMVHGRPLHDIMERLQWGHLLKILKGISAGIAYLHNQPTGPFVLCNICAENIFIADDFTPKIVDFKYCVVEGQMRICGSSRGYYPSETEGAAAYRKDEVLAFGVLALQLITKNQRTAFAVEDRQNK